MLCLFCLLPTGCGSEDPSQSPVPSFLPLQASRLLQGQLLVSMHGAAQPGEGKDAAATAAPSAALDATGVQVHGALDALCTYDGPLGYHRTAAGAGPRAGGGTVTVWAPTAQQARVSVRRRMALVPPTACPALLAPP